MLAVLDTETSRGGCRVVVEEEEGKIARVPVVGGLPAVVQFVFPRWSSGEDLLPLSGEVRPRPTFFFTFSFCERGCGFYFLLLPAVFFSLFIDPLPLSFEGLLHSCLLLPACKVKFFFLVLVKFGVLLDRGDSALHSFFLRKITI